MLVAVLCPSTMADLAKQLAALNTSLNTSLDTALYDCLEIRLDFCRDVNPEQFPALPLPAIFTLRSQKQGGHFTGTEQERLSLLEKLLALAPAYMDVEDDIPADRLRAWKKRGHDTTFILSYHDFSQTPDLEDRLASMMAMLPPQRGVLYKIACQANNTLDALRMLVFCRHQHTHLSELGSGLIGISMGEHGTTTRILAPVVHHGLCYCPTTTQTAPGQLTANELANLYNFANLTPETAIYGLLGDPVEQSQGHIFHNSRNKCDNRNAIYVKWRVTPQELSPALAYLSALQVQGLSVTMPLKNIIAPHCRAIVASPSEHASPSLVPLAKAPASEIPINTLRAGHSINPAMTSTATYKVSATVSANVSGIPLLCSLAVEHGYWEGTNTDGEGALRSLPFSVQGKTVIILGAGGAAMALATALHNAKAHCLVYNRSAKTLINGLPTLSLDALFNAPLPPHELIINTLPFTLALPFEHLKFHPEALAFDISYGNASRFLEEAEKAGCQILTGQRMFEEQAFLQRQFWGLT